MIFEAVDFKSKMRVITHLSNKSYDFQQVYLRYKTMLFVLFHLHDYIVKLNDEY